MEEIPIKEGPTPRFTKVSPTDADAMIRLAHAIEVAGQSFDHGCYMIERAAERIARAIESRR